jgi:elongation factor 1-gamma
VQCSALNGQDLFEKTILNSLIFSFKLTFFSFFSSLIFAQTPVFITDNGEKITSTPDIGRFIAGKAATAKALYPPSAKAGIDNWLNAASSLESSASTWIDPSFKSSTDEERDAAKTAIEQQLASIDSHLASSAALVGAAVTVADIAVACSLVGLYQFVLGKDIQSKYAHVTKWLQTCMNDANFISVLGELLVACAHMPIIFIKTTAHTTHCLFPCERIEKNFFHYASSWT